MVPAVWLSPTDRINSPALPPADLPVSMCILPDGLVVVLPLLTDISPLLTSSTFANGDSILIDPVVFPETAPVSPEVISIDPPSSAVPLPAENDILPPAPALDAPTTISIFPVWAFEVPVDRAISPL